MLLELTILSDLFFFVRKRIVDFQMSYKKLQANLSGIFIFISIEQQSKERNLCNGG